MILALLVSDPSATKTVNSRHFDRIDVHWHDASEATGWPPWDTVRQRSSIDLELASY